MISISKSHGLSPLQAEKRFITVLPGSLIVLLAAALTMSATSFVLILPLDKIEDSVRHLGAGRIFKPLAALSPHVRCVFHTFSTNFHDFPWFSSCFFVFFHGFPWVFHAFRPVPAPFGRFSGLPTSRE